MNNEDIRSYSWYIDLTGLDDTKRELVYSWLGPCYKTIHRFSAAEFLTNTYTDTKRISDTVLIGYVINSHNLQGISEIKFNFVTKTTIDSVEYPKIETERDRKKRELKETIEKAQKQLDELDD